MDFNLDNIKDIVSNIKNVCRVKWDVPQDHYNKYLYKGKSKYKELKSKMKKIRVKNKFLDMAHNNILRKVGEEFIEDSARADDLINRGFCILVEDFKEEVKETKQKVEKATKEVETAVKEVKKEKAVKEKTIASKLGIKRNATKK